MNKQKSFYLVSFALLCLALALWPVVVMGDPARAEAQYRTCAACHGQRGEGNIGPSLVGKPSDYLYSRLMQYKNGEMVGPQSALMWGQMAYLSPEDLQGLANYVEKLTRPVIED